MRPAVRWSAAPALALGLALGAAGAAGAQSLTSITTLGYPLQPVDARAGVLDGLGIGLQGFAPAMVNPATPAGTGRRGFVFAVENNNRDVRLGDEAADIGATRFPLLRLVFPLGRTVMTLGYGSVLDQAWGVVHENTLVVGSDEVQYRDRVESTGGVGQVQLGAALPLGERVAIGATLGALTGNQRIRRTRVFGVESGQAMEPFDETDAWRYRGLTASVGATWDPVSEVRVGGSVSWMGTVTADSADGRASSRSFDGPLQVAAGASGYLAPTLLLATSARWSGWSGTSPPVSPTPIVVSGASAARDTWELGVGLEWDDPASRDLRSYPVRAGFQYRQLPFMFGAEAPTEWFAGLGVGMRVGADIANPLARVDLALQRGERSAAGSDVVADLEEAIWRVALTISLFGN